MEKVSVIHHSVGLIVRLINTADGREIVQADIQFKRNGTDIFPMRKLDSRHIFVNFPCEPCTFTVKAKWYIPKQIELTKQMLEATPPIVEIHLVPDNDYAQRWQLDTIQGEIDGIEQIDAVKLSDTACMAQSFDDKRNIITLFNPHHLMLDRTYYAVVNPDDCTYEPIEIIEECGTQKYKIAASLKKSLGNYFPVARRSFGVIEPDGKYVIRLSETSSDRRWLVRFRVNGFDYFKVVDFSVPESTRLALPVAQSMHTDHEMKGG